MAKSKCSEIVTNPYTGEEIEITASKSDILQRRIAAQKDKWEQEQILEEGQQAAWKATASLNAVYNYLRSLPYVSLHPLTPAEYESSLLSQIRQRRRTPPTLEDAQTDVGISFPKKVFSKVSKAKNAELTVLYDKAEVLYNERMAAYTKAVEADRIEYQKRYAEEKRKIYNILNLMRSGSPTGAREYYTFALNRDNFRVNNDARYVPEFKNFVFRRRPREKGSKDLIGKVSLSYRIPNTEEIPVVAEYVYNSKAYSLEPKEYDAKTAQAWRKRVAESVLIRTVALLFRSDPFSQIGEITITGYMRYFDRGYGDDQCKNVMRATITREVFERIKLEQADPDEMYSRIMNGAMSAGMYSKEPYALSEI